MAEQQHNRESEDQNGTRREFIQELLDSGRKTGEYLDARTTRLPEIPTQTYAADDEPTMLFSPVQNTEQPEDEMELEAFFSDGLEDDAECPAEDEYDEPYDELYDPLAEIDARLENFLSDEPAEQPEPLLWDDEEDEPDEPYESAEDDFAPRGGVLLPTLKAAIYTISVLLGAVLLALLVWLAADDVFGLTDGDRAVTVTVAETDTVADVSKTLEAQGLIKYKTLFRIYCALTDAERKIDPGVYELNDYYDYMALVNGMIATSGARKTVTVTIPEGYDVTQILRVLADNGAADYDALCDAAANYPFEFDFLSDIPYGSVSRLEGYLFPDTYEFYVDDDADKVLSKFLKNFDRKLTDDLYDRLDELNASLAASGLETKLTMHDILKVASMIEKEAATSGERTSIASVIYNRLRNANFPYLQIDATVQYALGERKAQLTFEDLEVDSPYNTYLCEGLPAGPIACPGLSSIKAALYPAQTEFYYYALDRDGTHHFSKTRQEHEQFLASMEEQS